MPRLWRSGWTSLERRRITVDLHSGPQSERAAWKQWSRLGETKLHTERKAPKRAGNGSLGAFKQVRCSDHPTSSNLEKPAGSVKSRLEVLVRRFQKK